MAVIPPPPPPPDDDLILPGSVGEDYQFPENQARLERLPRLIDAARAALLRAAAALAASATWPEVEQSYADTGQPDPEAIRAQSLAEAAEAQAALETLTRELETERMALAALEETDWLAHTAAAFGDEDSTIAALRTPRALAGPRTDERLALGHLYLWNRLGPTDWVAASYPCTVVSIEQAAKTCTVRISGAPGLVSGVEYGAGTPVVDARYILRVPARRPAASFAFPAEPQMGALRPWIKCPPGGRALYYQTLHFPTYILRRATWPPATDPPGWATVQDLEHSPSTMPVAEGHTRSPVLASGTALEAGSTAGSLLFYDRFAEDGSGNPDPDGHVSLLRALGQPEPDTGQPAQRIIDDLGNLHEDVAGQLGTDAVAGWAYVSAALAGAHGEPAIIQWNPDLQLQISVDGAAAATVLTLPAAEFTIVTTRVITTGPFANEDSTQAHFIYQTRFPIAEAVWPFTRSDGSPDVLAAWITSYLPVHAPAAATVIITDGVITQNLNESWLISAAVVYELHLWTQSGGLLTSAVIPGINNGNAYNLLTEKNGIGWDGTTLRAYLNGYSTVQKTGPLYAGTADFDGESLPGWKGDWNAAPADDMMACSIDGLAAVAKVRGSEVDSVYTLDGGAAWAGTPRLPGVAQLWRTVFALLDG